MKRAHTSFQRNEPSAEEVRKETNADENFQETFEEENDQNQSNDGDAGPSTKRKRTSPIRNHFTIRFVQTENAEFAFCNYCSKPPIKLGGKSNASTGNLIRHLKRDHADIYSMTNETVQEKFVFSQERYRQSLIKWIVNSDQPFCSCQHEDFVELLKNLNPEASPLSAQTVKRDIMKKFDEGVAETKTRLSKVSSKFAFTVDAWTSKNVLPFIDIRAHWINDDWTYESVVVDFSFIEGDHGGKNLCNIFVDCLKRFEIPLSKVSAVTMDNASSNSTFMDFLRKHSIAGGTQLSKSQNRIRCLPHVLNLAVQDILSALKIPSNDDVDHYAYLDDLEDDEVSKLVFENNSDEEDDEEEEADESSSLDPTVAKLRKLIKKLRKSPQMREKLKKICALYDQKYLVPIIDVKTRWDSTFDMIERAIYLKAPIGVMCSKEKKLKNLLLTSAEWSELNTLRALLSKFRRSTKFMSMERRPTISAYLPTFRWIIQSVESFIRENPGPLASAANAGLLKLKKYEEEFQLTECSTIYVGVFLNPALKLNYFKEHGYTKANIKDIQKAVCEVLENDYGSETNQPCDEDNESEPDEFLSHMYKRSKPSREPKEFQKYINHPLSNEKVDLLAFWRSQKDEFPKLSKMAQDYLAIQGGSVPVERDFCLGTHLVTPKRCSLNPETVRACMCLKSWHKQRKLNAANSTANAEKKKDN